MIHYINELSVTDSLRESMQESGSVLPFTVNELSAVEYINNCAKWHWHPFVELAYVINGFLECSTPNGTIMLSTGEGCFVNANALHMNRMVPGSSDLRYRVLQFETGMLSGASVGIGAKYVLPIEKAPGLESIRLSPNGDVEGKILEQLTAVFDLASNEPVCYDLRIMGHIVTIWAELFMLAGSANDAGETLIPDTASQRVKRMLSFIHEHFSEAIGVDDIAGAASISRREAFRCFRQVLNTTPTLYLLQHRVNTGARLLMEDSRSITEISMDCGFASSSYFCKAFHDLTGVSPREFRHRNKK